MPSDHPSYGSPEPRCFRNRDRLLCSGESATVAKIEGVDLVLGSNEKADLVQYLSDAWNKVDTAKEETSEESITL